MAATPPFSHKQAARFYDMLGARLDTQKFYEAAALRDLVAHLELKMCRAILEFGCGTGRLAAKLFEAHLPREAVYVGLDVSATMVALTKRRLVRWSGRAEIRQSNGEPKIDVADKTVDRFICTYVLDLLSEADIHAVLGEAHRVLVPGGLLGVVSLRDGLTPTSRLVSRTWRGLHRLSPWLVGGCRPIAIRSFISDSAWQIEYATTVVSFGIPSEIVVAACKKQNQAPYT